MFAARSRAAQRERRQSGGSDALGYAEVGFTLSAEPGPHTVTASVADFFPVTFTALATAPAVAPLQ